MSKEDTKIKGKITKKLVSTALIGGFVATSVVILFDLFIWEKEIFSYFKMIVNFFFMSFMFGLMNYYSKTK